MRLYHFMPAKYALKAIVGRRLKVANLDEVNDPYESLAVGFKSHKHQEGFLNVIRHHMAKTFGIICFSEMYNDPLLWSHYADRCKGICLGFDVIRILNNNTNSFIMKVEYEQERFDHNDMGFTFRSMTDMSINRDSLSQLITTKHCTWKYEEESRLIIPRQSLDEDPITELLFFPFGNHMELREILIGFRCTEKNIESRLDKLVAGYSPDPPKVFLTRRSSSKFEIEKVSSGAANPTRTP